MEAERKYTDRDVRLDTDRARKIVEDYLAEYNGEFEFLVDCKMRVASDYPLTVGMMKGVLNCIRVDARYRGPLPEFDHTYEAEVIPMPKTQRRTHTVEVEYPRECDIEEFHEPHRIGPESLGPRRFNCYGKFAINREYKYFRDALVNDSFSAVVAKSGKMIHGITGDAQIDWYPNPHEFGFYGDSNIYFKTQCINPRFIKNGILLTGSAMDQVLADRAAMDAWIEEVVGYPPPPSQRPELQLCPRCW